jgi:hypothetical protein
METYEQYEADIMSFQNLFRTDKSEKQAGAELCQAQVKLWLAKLSYVYC